MAEKIDRKACRAEARTLLRDAQVEPRRFVALYMGIVLVLDLLSALADLTARPDAYLGGPVPLFAGIATQAAELVLGVGFTLYCMALRRGERAEYLTLFDGFSFVGKVLLVYVAEGLLISLWLLPVDFGMALLVLLAGEGALGYSFFLLPLAIPAAVAFYRYRFAVFNLCENPGIGAFETLRLSARQTDGYKKQLLLLDLSYLGWSFLLALPTLYFNAQYVMSLYGADPSFLPAAGWNSAVQTLVCGAWALGVSLFFLAEYHTAELGYFETAKRTSHTGAGLLPPGDDGSDQ
jgi:uncharacterized membrane protein